MPHPSTTDTIHQKYPHYHTITMQLTPFIGSTITATTTIAHHPSPPVLQSHLPPPAPLLPLTLVPSHAKTVITLVTAVRLDLTTIHQHRHASLPPSITFTVTTTTTITVISQCHQYQPGNEVTSAATAGGNRGRGPLLGVREWEGVSSQGEERVNIKSRREKRRCQIVRERKKGVRGCQK